MHCICGCGGMMFRDEEPVLVITQVTAERPHQIWKADLYKCKKCGNRIASGFGGVPIATAGTAFFSALLEKAKDRRHIVCTLMGGNCDD